MKRQFGFISRGYPYGTDILYVYCDKCGSFSIKTYIGARKWIITIVSCVLLATMVSARSITTVETNSVWWLYFILCCSIILALFKGGWGDKDYKCRKCGYTDIIINAPKDYASEIPKYNTRDYPSDMQVIDVSDDLTQKRYQGYWDDEYR